MSKRTVDALARWMAESVRPVPADQRRREAERLAAEFAAYAEDAGINIEQLEMDLGVDLVGYMEDRLTELSSELGDEL